VTPLAPDQWVLLLLVFLLGLFVGMYFLAGGKWKRRYREQERLHREELRSRDAAIAADRRNVDAPLAASARDEHVPRRRRWFR
jgi:uncharacterized membrane-anchored protein YhcB (DUF1043 family)